MPSEIPVAQVIDRNPSAQAADEKSEFSLGRLCLIIICLPVILLMSPFLCISAICHELSKDDRENARECCQLLCICCLIFGEGQSR